MSSADEDHFIAMKWIWAGASVITAIFGWGLTPWEAIKDVILSRGVSDVGKQQLLFTAYYTLPLTIGFCAIVFLMMKGFHRELPSVVVLGGAALILWLAGEAARRFGLGTLLPIYRTGRPPFMVPGKALEVVLTAYFNSYGCGLMISAFAIGCAIALQIERSLQEL